ncbi:hypothetical protein AB4225_18890 [Streptomyces sp. 2RAF24]|uniref:hypothetical protein n=1 Tax=Streptomyces sp. 2RAF24 TaxID=3232997 RepID=UPI003F9CB60F
MGVAVAWSVVVVGAGALLVVRQFLLYPCRPAEWEYAFGAAYGDRRRALGAVRRAKRRIEGSHREQAGRAERRVDEISKRGERQCRELARKRDDLLRERRGDAWEPAMGELWLHERAVLLLKEREEGQEGTAEVERTLPLAGLQVEFVPGRDFSYLRLLQPDGRRYSAKFPRQRFKEYAVQELGDRIHNRIQEERVAHVRRLEEADGIERRIEEIRADTAEKVLAAEAAREELIEAQREDERLLHADTAWEAERERWRVMTGRRPGWWWRW